MEQEKKQRFGVLDPDGNVIICSFDISEEKSIKRYISHFTEETWKDKQDQGYKCISCPIKQVEQTS